MKKLCHYVSNQTSNHSFEFDHTTTNIAKSGSHKDARNWKSH